MLLVIVFSSFLRRVWGTLAIPIGLMSFFHEHCLMRCKADTISTTVLPIIVYCFPVWTSSHYYILSLLKSLSLPYIHVIFKYLHVYNRPYIKAVIYKCIVCRKGNCFFLFVNVKRSVYPKLTYLCISFLLRFEFLTSYNEFPKPD